MGIEITRPDRSRFKTQLYRYWLCNPKQAIPPLCSLLFFSIYKVGRTEDTLQGYHTHERVNACKAPSTVPRMQLAFSNSGWHCDSYFQESREPAELAHTASPAPGTVPVLQQAPNYYLLSGGISQ